jgi:hypothetical protein
MGSRSAVRGAVLAVLALGASPALAKDHAFTVDARVKFPARERAALRLAAGPLTFTDVLLYEGPGPEEIEIAQARHPDDRCSPRFDLGVTNHGEREMKFHVTLSLEDADGTVYMQCEKKDSIDPGADDDRTLLCMGGVVAAGKSMKIVDWPKLTTIHIQAEVDPR